MTGRNIFFAGSLVTVFGAACVLAFVLWLDPFVGRAARLEFDEYVKDLGTMGEEKSERDVIFVYRNTGNQDLTIYGVELQCSCQNFKITSRHILPGSSGKLAVTVKRSRKGGPVSDVIAVKSTDAQRPTQFLEIKRFILLSTVVEPEHLAMKYEPGQPCLPKVLTVAGPTNDQEFKIERVESDAEDVVGDFRYLGIGPGNRRRWEVKVTLDTTKAGLASSSRTAKLQVSTSDKAKPVLTVPLTITRVAPIRVEPKSLTFLRGGSRSSKIQQVSLICRGDAAKIEVEPSVDELSQVHVSFISKNRELDEVRWVYSVEAENAADSGRAIRNGAIRFNFLPLEISVSVPFSIVQLESLKGESQSAGSIGVGSRERGR